MTQMSKLHESKYFSVNRSNSCICYERGCSLVEVLGQSHWSHPPCSQLPAICLFTSLVLPPWVVLAWQCVPKVLLPGPCRLSVSFLLHWGLGGCPVVPPGLCQLVSFLGSGALGSVSWLSVLPVWVQHLGRCVFGSWGGFSAWFLVLDDGLHCN